MDNADSKPQGFLSLCRDSFVLLFLIFPLSLAGLLEIHTYPVLVAGDPVWASFLTFWDLSLLSRIEAVFCWLGLLAPPFASVIVLTSLVKSRRLWAIVGRTCLLGLCLLFSLPTLGELFSVARRLLSERQYSAFANAVEARDPEKAIRLADRLTIRATGTTGYYKYDARSKSICQGLAHELKGDYETARQYYGDYVPLTDLTDPFSSSLYSCHARVFYKEGKRFEAFQAYCDLAGQTVQIREDFIGRFAEPTEANEICAQLAKRRVLFWDGKRAGAPIAPFEDYDAFLNFIETEYEKVEDQDAYRDAVEFWRDLAKTDITGEAPRCRAIDAFRKSVGLGEYYMPLHEFCQNDNKYLSSSVFWAHALLNGPKKDQVF